MGVADRDKFLTEAMGEAWKTARRHDGPKGTSYDLPKNPNFSTWGGFGKLWEWAQKQEWFWRACTMDRYNGDGGGKVMYPGLVHPDRFADALYAFLKERA